MPRRLITDPTLAKLGERVRQLRLDRDLSLTDLAKRSKLVKGYISTLESGKGNPTALTLLKVAKGLGVTVGDLFLWLTTAKPRNAKPERIEERIP